MSLVTRVNESCQTFECSIFSIGNTKNRESTRSWLIVDRIFNPWEAAQEWENRILVDHERFDV